MDGRKGRARPLALSIIATSLICSLGCKSCVNPVNPASPEVVARLQAVPAQCREHVYVMVINGLDPSNMTNAKGLAAYLESIGFPNTYFTPMRSCFCYIDQVLDIKRADPQARIALVGYSMGVCFAHKIAKDLKEDGVLVDLAIYLDPFTFNDTPKHDPEDATRIVNVITEPRLWGILHSDVLDGASNIQFLGVRHVHVPTTSSIVERVTEELTLLAAKP